MPIKLPPVLIYALLILSFGLIGTGGFTKTSVTWVGSYLLLFCTFYGYYSYPFKNTILKLGLGILTALLATAIGVHLFGAPSWKLASLQLSANALPASIYLGFDKLVIALCILLLWKGNKGGKWRDRYILPVFIIVAFVISVIGINTRQFAFDPKLVPLDFLGLWIIKNLVFVSLPEELFFRGFIQRELGNWNLHGGWIIASLLFGMGHLSGGISYAFLSTLAGLLYGWLYLRTSNIYISVLAHFAINALHLGLFTYPYLLTT